jgi:hypothetical protein
MLHAECAAVPSSAEDWMLNKAQGFVDLYAEEVGEVDPCPIKDEIGPPGSRVLK